MMAVDHSGGLRPVLPYDFDSLENKLLVKTNIAGYFFDGYLSIDHEKQAIITSHPIQSGANIADHIYLQPATCSMRVAMSDCMESLLKSQFQDSFSRSVSAYHVLQELFDMRIPFQVTTRLEIYQNMVIKSISVNDGPETLYGMEADVQLEQLFISEVKTVKVSERPDVTNITLGGNVAGEAMATNQTALFWATKDTPIRSPGFILPQ